MSARRTLLGIWMAWGMGLAGCGAPPPKPRVEAPAPVQTAKEAAPPPAAESEVGGLNQEKVEAAFTSLRGAIEDCFAEGAGRVPALGGHFKVKLRIDREGGARWAYMSESDLGDRGTESCFLKAAREKQWPKPVGGEGLAEKDFDIDPAAKWVTVDPKRAKIAIKLARKETFKCRKGNWGKFAVTLYVRSNGRVISGSVTPPNEKGEAVVDCMVGVLKKLHFVGGNGKFGKLRFDLI